jgi:hypothetical protein
MDITMEELKTLLGMDLPEDAKKLLESVNTAHLALTDANKTMVDTIASKENANAELIQARKDLKAELQELKDSKSKTDDKSVQEKLDALNAEWNEKYQGVVGERDTIKTDMLNKTRFDEFSKLNVASLLPSDWSKEQVAMAMSTIENQVLGNTIHDEAQGWIYKDGDVTMLNGKTGKPMTIEDKFNSIKESGAIDMFLASGSNSGGGTPPSGGNAPVTIPKNLTPAQKAELIGEIGHDAYLAGIKQ